MTSPQWDRDERLAIQRAMNRVIQAAARVQSLRSTGGEGITWDPQAEGVVEYGSNFGLVHVARSEVITPLLDAIGDAEALFSRLEEQQKEHLESLSRPKSEPSSEGA